MQPYGKELKGCVTRPAAYEKASRTLSLTNLLNELFMKTLCFIFAFTLFLLRGGCEGDTDVDNVDNTFVAVENPSQFLLGKWRETACKNPDNRELTPTFHTIEFVSGETGETYYGPYPLYIGGGDIVEARYWMEGDSLYIDAESASYSHYIYLPLFDGSDRLLLKYVYGDMVWSMDVPTSHTYERIK
jgi:hypothetical protein